MGGRRIGHSLRGPHLRVPTTLDNAGKHLISRDFKDAEFYDTKHLAGSGPSALPGVNANDQHAQIHRTHKRVAITWRGLVGEQNPQTSVWGLVSTW